MENLKLSADSATTIGLILAFFGTITAWFWRSMTVSKQLGEFVGEYRADRAANMAAHKELKDAVAAMDKRMDDHLENTIARIKR